MHCVVIVAQLAEQRIVVPRVAGSSPVSHPSHRHGVSMKRVYLSSADNKIAGVCGGFAESLSIDPTFIRLLFVAVFLSPLVSTAVLFYLLCWIVIPRDPGYSK